MFPRSGSCLAENISKYVEVLFEDFRSTVVWTRGEEHTPTRSTTFPMAKLSKVLPVISEFHLSGKTAHFRVNLEQYNFSDVKPSDSKDLLEFFLSLDCLSFHHIVMISWKPSTAFLLEVPNLGA